MQTQGTLAPGQPFTIQVPLKVDQSKVNADRTPINPDSLISSMIFDPATGFSDDRTFDLYYRIAERGKQADGTTDFLADASATPCKQYYAVTENSDGTYSALPDKNGELNPAQDHIAQISSSDINVNNGVGIEANGTADSGFAPVYTGGTFTYTNLEGIKDSVTPYGYTVDELATKNFTTAYPATVPKPSSAITTSAGCTVSDYQYVVVRPVISTHNVTITQGDKWDPTSAIDWVLDHDGNRLSTAQLEDGRTVQLSPAINGATDKPGTYTFTYTYAPDGVSDTFTLTVKPKPVTLPTPGNKGGAAAAGAGSGGSASPKPAALAATGSDVIVPATIAALAFGLGAAGITLARKRTQR